MKAALAALALALSAAVAMAQDSKQMTPEQAREYFKPGGKFERDNPGIRQRTRDAEMERRAGGQTELEGIAHPGLRATAVTSPLCKSLISTMLCGFLLLMSRAASIA
jgi:hypothetical protein